MGVVTIHNQQWYPFDYPNVEQVFDVIGSSSYANSGTPTNTGDTISATDILERLMPGVNDLTQVHLFTAQPRTDGYTIALDPVNKKFVIRDNTGTEVTNGTPMNTKTWRCSIKYFTNRPFLG